jgi:hypothetical protein
MKLKIVRNENRLRPAASLFPMSGPHQTGRQGRLNTRGNYGAIRGNYALSTIDRYFSQRGSVKTAEMPSNKALAAAAWAVAL